MAGFRANLGTHDPISGLAGRAEERFGRSFSHAGSMPPQYDSSKLWNGEVCLLTLDFDQVVLQNLGDYWGHTRRYSDGHLSPDSQRLV